MKTNIRGVTRLNQTSNQENKNYHCINLSTFLIEDARMISSYLNLLLRLNINYFYNIYDQGYSNLHSEILNNLNNDTKQYNDWDKSISIMKKSMKKEFKKLFFEGGGTQMSTYIDEIKEQILQLNPIKITEDDTLVAKNNHVAVEELISEIREEVKKGNRVSFKLMQELQTSLESMSANFGEKDRELINHSIQGFEKKTEEFLKLAIQAIDSMDLIYQSALKTNLSEWAPQIETVINDFIQVLDTFGIEELKVKGLFFDGETMISIGTVSPDYAPDLKRYQVYSVHERGFRFKESCKLIREAKVTTIY